MATELNSAPDSAAEVPRGDDEPEEVEEEAGRSEDVEVEEHGQTVGQEALQVKLLHISPFTYGSHLLCWKHEQ